MTNGGSISSSRRTVLHCFVTQTQNSVWAEWTNCVVCSVCPSVRQGKARAVHDKTIHFIGARLWVTAERNGTERQAGKQGWIISVILELHGRYCVLEFPVSLIWNVDIYWRRHSDSSGHSAFGCRTEEGILGSELSWLSSVPSCNTCRRPSQSFKLIAYSSYLLNSPRCGHVTNWHTYCCLPKHPVSVRYMFRPTDHP